MRNDLAALTRDAFKNFYNTLDSPHEKRVVIYHRCATDLPLFFSTFFPHYCDLPFNRIHWDLFDSFSFGRRNEKENIIAPRGYSKSTVYALLKVIHAIAYSTERYIIIASNTDQQSIQKIKDVRSELLDLSLIHI